MKDLFSREDVVLLVDTFYDKVVQDETIGYIFNDVAQVDWELHKPKMYDFWETSLFHRMKYTGNPMRVHKHLDQKEKLSPAHFDRWIALFHETVDELFRGEYAELAKQRADSIAGIMSLKIAGKSFIH
jgi:hemoglobin